MRRTQDAGGGIKTMDVPFRFLPCLVAGLAYYIALKIPDGIQRLEILKAQYDEAWLIAAGEDQEKAAVRFVPRQMYIGSGT
jgi:ethanolamine utilization microcompartment shell protein EutL